MNSISLLLDNICPHQSVNILQMFVKLNHSMRLQIYCNSNHSYNSWHRGHQRKKFHTIRHQLSYPSFFKDKFEPYFYVNNFSTGRFEQPLLFTWQWVVLDAQEIWVPSAGFQHEIIFGFFVLSAFAIAAVWKAKKNFKNLSNLFYWKKPSMFFRFKDLILNIKI